MSEQTKNIIDIIFAILLIFCVMAIAVYSVVLVWSFFVALLMFIWNIWLYVAGLAFICYLSDKIRD